MIMEGYVERVEYEHDVTLGDMNAKTCTVLGTINLVLRVRGY